MLKHRTSKLLLYCSYDYLTVRPLGVTIWRPTWGRYNTRSLGTNKSNKKHACKTHPRTLIPRALKIKYFTQDGILIWPII